MDFGRTSELLSSSLLGANGSNSQRTSGEYPFSSCFFLSCESSSRHDSNSEAIFSFSSSSSEIHFFAACSHSLPASSIFLKPETSSMRLASNASWEGFESAAGAFFDSSSFDLSALISCFAFLRFSFSLLYFSWVLWRSPDRSLF